MAVSTLHHHFRALSAMSPVQYQKQIRLQAARARMLADDVDAATAAFEVGYESASQFNREYGRLFGQPRSGMCVSCVRQGFKGWSRSQPCSQVSRDGDWERKTAITARSGLRMSRRS
jgi:AraC-like DNA-binding protein